MVLWTSSAEPHYFNQSVMLHRAEGFDEAALRQTMTKLTEHHDACVWSSVRPNRAMKRGIAV
uniref:hypothetical protein n=1 Tax=Paenibacillus polymyxa TaxID=1406 RepID=UPI00215B9626|nr:hypothetical protein [Paenibacillus polymyxa]